MRVSTACSILLLLHFIGAGCAKPIIVNAFEGPDRPDAEIATLELDFRARLLHLDGRPVAGIPSGLDVDDPANPRIVRLLPGEHELLVGMRPYIQTSSYPVHTYIPTGDCHGKGGGSAAFVTHYQTTTTHHAGSRENERLAFTVAPGGRYRLRVDDPPDWFSRRQRWSVRVTRETSALSDPIVSTSLGRQPHTEPARPADGLDALMGAAAMKTVLGPLESPR